MRPSRSPIHLVAAAALAVGLLAASCGSSSSTSAGTTESAPATTAPDAPGALRLVTHDSFAVSDSVLQAFEATTGIQVEIVHDGDAVEMVNKAILTKDDPQGDVLFGIDSNTLTKAFDANLFEPYESPGLATVDPAYQLDAEHRVTPVDHGDVCLNYDKAWFAGKGLQPPTSMDDLTSKTYEGELVTENPATSTPGLAFLLATVAKYGEDGWQDYWKQLRSNEVSVVDGWEAAYYTSFSGSSGKGDKPIVVSYATSPPAEVLDVDPPPADTPTGVIEDSCFRQIEFAGVLTGSKRPAAARQFIDFLLSNEFQDDVPPNMYVLPVSSTATVPETFAKYSANPASPLSLPSDQIAADSSDWIDAWTRTVLGMTRTLGRSALVLVPLAFLAVLFVYPVVAILGRGLRPGGHWQVGVVREVVSDPFYRHVAWFTLWQAAASTVLTVVVALPVAAVFARFEFRGRRIMWSLLLVPFVLPTVVVGAAFLALLGPRPALGVDLHDTIWLVLVAHVFFNLAVVVRTVGGLWGNLDPRLEEAARTLGASPLRAFREVTLPLLMPSIAAASSIVFLFCFTSFGVVLLLGGARARTLEVEIYTQTARLLHLDVAAVLALLQLVGVGAALLLYARYQRRRSITQALRPRSEVARRPRTAAERGFVASVLIGVGLLVVVPLATLAWRSISTPSGPALTYWRALGTSRRGSTLFVSPWQAVVNSLTTAAVATVVAVVVGGMAAWVVARRGGGRSIVWFDAALMLPLGTSAVTVGFGFLIALDHPPFDLRDSWWLVPLAQATVAVPFVIRTLVPVLRSIDGELRAAASVLGASPARAFREVDLPIVFRAVLVSAGFAFAVSLGEFGATVFLARSDHPTVPIAIYRFLGAPGALNLGQAMALSTLLMFVTGAVVLLIDRVRIGSLGAF